MLVGSQLKLAERRSHQRFNGCISSPSSVIPRPCTLNNIAQIPKRTLNTILTPERRSPELRVVSINLENSQIDANTNKKTERTHRMPMFCIHAKRAQKLTSRTEQNYDNDFLVRGFELGKSRNHDSNPSQECDRHDYLSCLENGIQMQLTDCCQCVCDLFNSSYMYNTQHDDRNFATIAMEGCTLTRPPKTKYEVPAVKESIDANEVISVKMSSKTQ